MKIVYPAIFTPYVDGSGGYTVSVPDMEGCATEGDDMVAAIENGTKVACEWILEEMKKGKKYPVPRSRESVRLGEGSFVQMLLLEIEE